MNNFRRLLLQGQKEEKYVTLSGNGKCINTGIYGAYDIKVETKAFMNNIDKVDFIIYSEDSNGKDRFSLLKSNRKIRTDYEATMNNIDTVSVNQLWYPTVYIKDRNKTFINGELVMTNNFERDFESGNNIWIAAPTSQYRDAEVYIYYFKLYKDDVLLLDLIPYNETDMIDTLTGNIYTAQ